MIETIAASLAGASGVPLTWAAIRSIYGGADRSDESHDTITADGWRLALARYRPDADTPPRRHPVLIVPGLAANRFSVDLASDASLPRALAARGWDAWVLEMRGHGRSDRPSLGGTRAYDWTFDHHVRFDLPAGIDCVRAATGAECVHVIGHSLGGIIAYAFMALGGSVRIRSATVIGSSLDYSRSESDFHHVRHLVFITDALPVIPIGWLATLTAPLGARGPSRLDEFNICYPNVEPALYRRLTAISFHPVPSAVLAQMVTAFEPGGGGLRTFDRRTRYLDDLASVDVPILSVAGTRDRQCPPDAAESTLARAGRGPRRLAVFGRTHGQAEDYGHFDLLMGRRAATEVTPTLADWLTEHD